MGVLTADINVSSFGSPTKLSFSANASDTFFRGSIVFADEAGGCQLVPEAADVCLGICAKNQVITASGQEVEVYVDGCFETPLGTNIAAADEGRLLILDIGSTQSDNIADFVSARSIGATGGDVTLQANDIVLGRILRVKSASMIIKLIPGGMYDITTTAGGFV